MLRLAGQTAGAIRPEFFCGHSWVAGGVTVKGKKKIDLCFQIFFMGPLAN